MSVEAYHVTVVPVILREVVSDEGELAYGIVDGNRRVAGMLNVILDIIGDQNRALTGGHDRKVIARIPVTHALVGVAVQT